MGKYYVIGIYINKGQKVIIIPMKRHTIGLNTDTEPFEIFEQIDWEHMVESITKMMIMIENDPKTDVIGKNVYTKASGIKSFKKFSKEFICLKVRFDGDAQKYEVYNNPRLEDGSYGTEKNHISEQYSHIFSAPRSDTVLLKESLQKAYQESQAYLEKISE